MKETLFLYRQPEQQNCYFFWGEKYLLNKIKNLIEGDIKVADGSL